MKELLYSIAACAGLALAVPVAYAEDVTMDQLPSAVRQTLQRELGEQAQVGDMERDQDRGRTVYEIEFVENGRKFEIDIGEDGRVLNRHPD